MNSIELVSLKCRGKHGTKWKEVAREAIQLAASHGRDVELEHAGATYQVQLDSLIKVVAETISERK